MPESRGINRRASTLWLSGWRKSDIEDICLLTYGIETAEGQVLSGLVPFQNPQSDALRMRREFKITETELRLMAAAAIMGLSSTPKEG